MVDSGPFVGGNAQAALLMAHLFRSAVGGPQLSGKASSISMYSKGIGPMPGGRFGATLADIYDGLPEFTDLSVMEEWTGTQVTPR